jgi:epoxyqueuosine reductase
MEPWGGFVPFPVPDYRFDQKNEVFKRAAWDETMVPHSQRFYRDVVYQDRAGYRKLDFSLRNASWNLEWSFGMGNSRSNSGLYSWDSVSPKIQPYLDVGGEVSGQPGGMSLLVKRAARFLGADLVGIAPVHPNWVYSHEYNLLTREHYPLELPEGLDRVVVLAVAMDYRTMRSSPSAVGGASTGLGYTRMALVANLVATFIRGLGYRAAPAGNDTALSVPLAMAAGLGESSRMGLLVTERFGPRVRLCKVFTDLPLAPDSYRPFGVDAFCRKCKACALHCPSRAITAGEKTDKGPNISSQSGVRKWYVDGEKCFAYWAQNRMDCAVCIRVCPFNKAPGVHHDAVRAVVRRTSVFNGLFARTDHALGYDRVLPAGQFWPRGSDG